MDNHRSLRYFLRNALFARSVYVFLFIGMVGMLFFKHGDAVLLVNTYCTYTFFDYFFRAFTAFGNGIVFVVAIVAYMFVSYQKALQYAIVGLLVLVVSFFLKHIVFGPLPRPTLFFNLSEFHYIIPHVDFARHFSFPSGHTMTAFAFFALASYHASRKSLLYIYVILAFIVGLSRIYLLMHFFRDVYAGASIGLALMVFGVFLSRYIHVPPYRGLIKRNH
ncbi:MAG: phosphatase PAP2 family protein [Bacteroidales bacterium]|jgi:membrane-associated phospholipid phosphatase|nr:phosphatase PAP2 family protein [Bacteroidales bacterium]